MFNMISMSYIPTDKSTCDLRVDEKNGQFQITLGTTFDGWQGLCYRKQTMEYIVYLWSIGKIKLSLKCRGLSYLHMLGDDFKECKHV